MVIDSNVCQATKNLTQQHPEVGDARVAKASVVNRNIEISCANTTLIGDYTSVKFSSLDPRWLVQAQGNATLASTLALIKDGMIAVDRWYIFLQLGGNQVRSADKQKIYSQVLDIVVAIGNKNANSHIYFVAVLPRIIDNTDIKPFIMNFNRGLAAAVHQVNIIFERIRFLPVQLRFLNEIVPRREMFDEQNPLLLSQLGVELFQKAVFQLTGFVRNE